MGDNAITTFDGKKHDTGELLKKMMDYEFDYGYLGKEALSCSLLKVIIQSPKRYIELIDVGQKETQPLRDGKLLHMAVLEPEKFEDLVVVDVKSKNTKTYKEAVEEFGTVYTTPEIETALLLATTLHDNVKVQKILKGAEFEVPAIAMIDGIPFRGKADILKGSEIIDVKTTVDIKKFKYSAYKYSYDLQAYLYLQLFPEAKTFTFLCIDKATKDIAIYECSDEFLQSGKDKLEQGIADFNFFFRNKDLSLKDYIIYDTV